MKDRIFGKFRLLANLGAGGMGEVFLALSRSSLGGVNKLVVIKRLRHFAEDEVRSEARQMFLNEARLATLLNHPNIVQTNDVGVEDEHLFLTMEYLEGQPLNTIVRANKAKGDQIEIALGVKLISDALVGLQYAHDLKDYDGTPLSIVHRDLSPHNLFVTYEGVVKIVDFGIAKTAVSAKTEQGVIKGKFAYMAPEQAADEKIDRRADVFVMGIVLWELLTGERLVYRRNDVHTVNRLLNEKFPPPSSVRPIVDRELDEIVMKALARNLDERYATARDMRDALERYLLSKGRSVRQEDIAKLVGDLFCSERTLMRQKIQTFIASTHDDPLLENLPALSTRPIIDATTTPSGSSKAIAPNSTLAATMSGSFTAAPPSMQSMQGPVAPTGRKRALVFGAAVAFAVVLLAFAAFRPRESASQASAVGDKASAAAAGPGAPTDTAAPAPPPAAEPTRPADAPAASQVAAATAAAPRHHPGFVPARSAPPPSRPAAAPQPASPPAAPAPSPAPAPTATSTSHARVFNTTL